MDLMTLQRKNYDLGKRSYGTPSGISGSSDDSQQDRINDLVRRTNLSKPKDTKWGGKEYPINVSEYGQFLSSLQTLAWVLRDVGFDVQYLTKGGLHYTNTEYLSYPGLFDPEAGKISALVAIGKEGKHYRFSRDGKELRVRKFDNLSRALSPMRDGDTAGTKPVSPAIAKEIVRVMKTQSILNP